MNSAKALTVRETALKLQCTQKWVRDLLYEGKLEGASKIGRQWWIPTAAVEAHLRQREATNQR